MTLSSATTDSKSLYLDLMKRSLLNLIYADPNEKIATKFGQTLSIGEARATGLDWPRRAHTMIGMKRLDSLQWCVEDALEREVPGDLIETGVWRGGACILMRAVLKAYHVADRRVWIADSFQGLPPPNPQEYPLDAESDLHTFDELAVSRTDVERNFEAYGLLDDQIRFLEGWFKDTLPVAPIDQIAVLRLDGDLYESTMDALSALYPKLSPGGYAIIDDYGAIGACRQAVTDYRDEHRITEEIHNIDWTGIYWQRA
jgi:hypothetical protein